MHLHVMFVALTVFIAKETEGLGFCRSREHPCSYRCYTYGNKTSDLCRCRYGECPTDWTDRRRVIAFDSYRKPGNRIDTHQYMFCHIVIPQRLCTKDEELQPIWMQHSKETFESATLHNASCRCQATEPMLSKKIYKDDGGKSTNNYIHVLMCYNRMPPCAPKQLSSHRTIATLEDDVANYTENHCKCEPGLPFSDWNDRDRVFILDASSLWHRHFVTVEYAFCRKQIPRTICTPSKLKEEPAKIKSKHGKYEFARFQYARCRCPNGKPWMAKRVYEEYGFLHEYFVCPSDLPNLGADKTCISRLPTYQQTTVYGKCARDHFCSLEDTEPDFIVAGEQLGYCKSRYL